MRYTEKWKKWHAKISKDNLVNFPRRYFCHILDHSQMTFSCICLRLHCLLLGLIEKKKRKTKELCFLVVLNEWYGDVMKSDKLFNTHAVWHAECLKVITHAARPKLPQGLCLFFFFRTGGQDKGWAPRLCKTVKKDKLFFSFKNS